VPPWDDISVFFLSTKVVLNWHNFCVIFFKLKLTHQHHFSSKKLHRNRATLARLINTI